MYHVFHCLGKKKYIYIKKQQKCITGPILKPTYDQKSETLDTKRPQKREFTTRVLWHTFLLKRWATIAFPPKTINNISQSLVTPPPQSIPITCIDETSTIHPRIPKNIVIIWENTLQSAIVFRLLTCRCDDVGA